MGWGSFKYQIGPPSLEAYLRAAAQTMADSKPKPLARAGSKVAITVKHMKRDQTDRRKTRHTLGNTDAIKDKQVEYNYGIASIVYLFCFFFSKS